MRSNTAILPYCSSSHSSVPSPIPTSRSFLRTSAFTLGSPALFSFAQTASAQKTVLLHCGWVTKNIGDIGHTLGTLRFLKQYLP